MWKAKTNKAIEMGAMQRTVCAVIGSPRTRRVST